MGRLVETSTTKLGGILRMNAEYLAKIGKALDTIHVLSDFPLSRLDRIIHDMDEGLTQDESISDQIGELESAKSQIENILIELNKI